MIDSDYHEDLYLDRCTRLGPAPDWLVHLQANAGNCAAKFVIFLYPEDLAAAQEAPRAEKQEDSRAEGVTVGLENQDGGDQGRMVAVVTYHFRLLPNLGVLYSSHPQTLGI